MARSREEIKSARRQFAREVDGRQRDLPARRVAELSDAAAVAAQTAAETVLADASALDDHLRFSLPADPNSAVYEKLVRLYVMSTPGFRDWLGERVAAFAPTFTVDMTISEYEAQMADLEAELLEAERASRQAPLLAARAELDERLVALETD